MSEDTPKSGPTVKTVPTFKPGDTALHKGTGETLKILAVHRADKTAVCENVAARVPLSVLTKP